jgi:hypothetical protein
MKRNLTRRQTRRATVTLGLAAAVAVATAIGGAAASSTGDAGLLARTTASPANLAMATQVYRETPATPSPTAISVGSGSADASLKLGAGKADKRPRLSWKVGFDRESLDPTPAMIAAGFHLGGFGLGPTRQSTGPAVDGDGTVEHIYARAMAISNLKGDTMLLGALENQGTFAAYKEGPYGIWDIRQQVSHDTGVPVENIVVNSDHSHAGPDMIGLWGGVPVSYMQQLHDATVKALDTAYATRVLADLRVGTNIPVVPDSTTGGYLKGTASPGEYFVHSQFSKDTGQNGIPGTNYDDSLVNTQLRVLQAVDRKGTPLGTLINYSAHADVMGGSNLGYSADWPGRVARATELALKEPVAVTMVADVGRSQPPRPHSDAKCGQAGHPTCDIDQLDTWTRIFTPWVIDAVQHSAPVQGTEVAGKEVFTREAATNPALLGVSYSGEGPARGTGAYRSITAPWVTGANTIGTFASAHRLGSILLTANPGEAYPDVRFGVAREVMSRDPQTGRLVPPQAFFTFGLANDQLGYLIAPASEYPWITYSNVGNDNSFFNVSAQYGDHLYCTQKDAALSLGFASTDDLAPYGANAQQPECPVLGATDGIPMGPAPQQPWALGDGINVGAPGN